MDNTLTWLHLSDLHCCPRTDWDARHVLAALRDDLAQLADEHELRPDLIFFTGDAAFGELPGHPLADQLDEAARFFEELREHCGVARENVFLVPGNHDVDRSAIAADDTAWLDERRKAYDRAAVDEMLRQGHGAERWRRIMTRLDAYRAFLERAGYKHLLGDPERLIYAQSRDVRGIRVGVAGLSSAWSCHGDDRGRLWMGGAWQVATLEEELDDAGVRVALVHHPRTWLGEAEDPELEPLFERVFDFHLHGHEHQLWVRPLAGEGNVRIAAGACYDRSDRDNGYNLVRLDFENEKVEVWLRSYETAAGAWQRREIAGKTDAHGIWHLDGGRCFNRLRTKADELAVLSSERLVDEIFHAVRQDPILMLLAQDGRVEPEVIASIRERARALCGPQSTFHVTPPGSPAATSEEYFARLGRQCRLAADVGGATGWEDALDRRLSEGERLFLLISRFEKGSEEGRRQLGAVLRALSERYGQALMVVLVGGERLAALKYENEALSVLSSARRLDWPEATADDVLVWQRREFPELALSRSDAEEIRALCGGQPRWVRFCLERRRRRVADERRALADCDEIWRIFTPYRSDAEARRRICRWLSEDDLGPAEPWIADELKRRLYWRSALRTAEGRLVWRSEVVSDVGRRVLG